MRDKWRRGEEGPRRRYGRDDQSIATPALETDTPEDGLEFELDLTDLAYGGDAVGRFEGRAVFVPGALPDERVRVRLTRERANYARAELLDVLKPSPDRVEPRYPELNDSGGFQWQHIAYPAQIAWKTRIVRQLLTRIGKFSEPRVRQTIGMPDEGDAWRYRTVAQFAVAPNGAIGFRRAESHEVLDMDECPLVHPQLDTLYQGVREWMQAHWGSRASDFTERFSLRVAVGAGDEALPSGALPGGLPMVGSHSFRGSIGALLTIEARPGAPFDHEGGAEAVASAMRLAIPGLAGVVILGLPVGRGRVIAGQDFVHDRVMNRIFRISAGSFFQVNPTQTPALVNRVVETLRPRPHDVALDGYSGAGLFSLFLANSVSRVIAIESQPSAVGDARESARINGVTNVTTYEGVLERVIGTMRRQRERIDIALVDPPRAGCLPRALNELAAIGPRTLVYVSCDPSTLARDLRLICDAGYMLTSVQPVDMFPNTSHIECVATCERITP